MADYHKFQKSEVSNVCLEGIKLAEKFQVKFIETSATLHENVDQLFHGIITQIRLRGLERNFSSCRITEDSRRNNTTLQSCHDSLWYDIVKYCSK